MSVTSILRDTPNNVCLVRMISTDTVAQVSSANYILDQMDNIRALNSGFWQWYETDMIVCSCSDGNAIYEFTDSDFSTLQQYGAIPAGSVTPHQVQTSAFNYAVDTGPDETHFVVALNPAVTSLQDGLFILFKAANSNDLNPTLQVNGLPAKPITGQGGAALQAGDIFVNAIVEVYYNSIIDSFILQNPQTITGPLASSKIIVGSAGNFATEVNMSGDATISNTGAVTVSMIGGKPIALSGAFTTEGSFTQTFVFTGDTQVTFPTTGTLATTAGLAAYLPLAGGTMVGNLILNGDATLGLQAVTLNQLNAVVSGVIIQPACVAATTVNLVATQAGAGVGATLTNADTMAAFSVDGVSPAINSRILVKNQTLTQHNGIYTLTTVGSGAVNWVLTRATDYDQAAEINPGDLVVINTGTLNAGTGWLETATVVTVDTDPILFSPFNLINAGTGLTKTGNTISLDVPVSVVHGGTGLVATTINQLLYSSANNTIAGLATANNGLLVTGNTGVPSILAGPGTSRNLLMSNAALAPSFTTETWAAPGTTGNVLTSDGTNWTSAPPAITTVLTTKGDLLGFTTVDARVPVGTINGQVLQVNSAQATGLAYSTATYPTTATGTGTILRADGTNWVASTATYPDTATLGDILIGSAANVFSSLAGNTTAVKQYLSQTGTGVISAAPVWATISGGDITGAALTKTDDTNVTLTLGGTPATALLRAASLTLGWTGVLSLARGGSNADLSAAVSNGGIVWTNATQMQILAGTATASKMLLSGASATPSWSTSTIPSSAGATANKVLLSDGTNYALSTPTFPNASATSGKIIQSDGTNWLASTPTYPAVAGTSGNVITSDGTNFTSVALAPSTANYALPQMLMLMGG